MTYDNQDPYSQYDPSGLTPQELLARIESVKTRIASTVTQLGVAESQIAQSAEQILLRVEKDGVISAINQSAEEIRIIASRINLVGAVTVLSEITGDLGDIIAGRIFGIEIHGGYISSETNIDIGADLRIGVVSNGGGYFDNSTIHFGDYASITANNLGGLSTMDFNVLKVDFTSVSVMDFSGVSVQGLVVPGYATTSYVDSEIDSNTWGIMAWVTDNFEPKTV